MRVFDWSARPAERRVTVAALREGKGTPARHAQVTLATPAEAVAAQAAGIEMGICRAASVPVIRQAAPDMFLTAALGFDAAVEGEAVLRNAIDALVSGADAVLCTRRLAVVELLASEGVPVMGHLGFVPRKSTWTGRIRGVGRTPEEAATLWQAFRDLENAGAFAAEAELVAAPLLAEITRRSSLVTVSLGSGGGGDVIFLFSEDICGTSSRRPRHARSYGDLATLERRLEEDRTRAFRAFRDDVAAAAYPAPAEEIALPDADILLDTVFDRGR